MEKNTLKHIWWYTGLSIGLLLLFVVDLLTGAALLPVADVWSALTGSSGVPDYVQAVVLNFRLPKAIAALLAGMALSVSGLQMQTIFRNPLADPYVLGISSGSGFGVALFVLGSGFWGVSSLLWVQNLGMTLAGWMGAFVMLAVITAVSARLRDTMSMLVMGIMVGGAVSALVGVMQYFSEATALKTYVLWTMGSFSAIAPEQLLLMAPAILLGLFGAFVTIKWLNALMLGDNYAQSMGIHIKHTRTLLLLISGLLAGTVTAFCGPIGFIGIAVPHVARMIFGTANHKTLMPATMLIGGSVMLLSDILSQLPLSGGVLPINTITALLGIPVIITIIFRNQRGF